MTSLSPYFISGAKINFICRVPKLDLQKLTCWAFDFYNKNQKPDDNKVVLLTISLKDTREIKLMTWGNRNPYFVFDRLD